MGDGHVRLESAGVEVRCGGPEFFTWQELDAYLPSVRTATVLEAVARGRMLQSKALPWLKLTLCVEAYSSCRSRLGATSGCLDGTYSSLAAPSGWVRPPRREFRMPD
jgi:hypothetical protein